MPAQSRQGPSTSNMNMLQENIVTLALLAILFCLQGTSPQAAFGGSGARDVVEADIAAQTNPDGMAVSLGWYRRWGRAIDKELGIPSSYLQTGVGISTTPAYGRISLHGEWLAAVFAKVRFQYDQYRFYGTNTSLLSFPTGTAAFGKGEVDALEGREQAGNGNRILVRPTLYAKAGPVILMNQTDLAYFHFTGAGPYFLEWTYETLLKDGDHVVENRTNVLYPFLQGPGDVSLLAGPYFEIMHTGAADLTRKRAGVMASWVPWGSIGPLMRPRFYGQVGYYLQDRNRDGEYTAAFGMGCDLDL